MKIASSKAKGRTFQQYIGKKIADAIGMPFGKDLDVDSRGMGQSGTDIILRGDALKRFPFAVECKRTEKLSIPQWIEQSKANTKDGLSWLLFFKRSRQDACVVLDADVFFELIKRASS